MERPELDNAGAVLLRAVDSMSDGFVLFDANDRIILCNQVYASMLEGFGGSHLDAKALIGMHVETIIRHQVERGQPIPAEYGGDVDRCWPAQVRARLRAIKADTDPLSTIRSNRPVLGTR